MFEFLRFVSLRRRNSWWSQWVFWPSSVREQKTGGRFWFFWVWFQTSFQTALYPKSLSLPLPLCFFSGSHYKFFSVCQCDHVASFPAFTFAASTVSLLLQLHQKVHSLSLFAFRCSVKSLYPPCSHSLTELSCGWAWGSGSFCFTYLFLIGA